jgi:hypothetical protein
METTPNTFCTRLAALTEGLEYDSKSQSFKGKVEIEGKKLKVEVSTSILFDPEVIKSMMESEPFPEFLFDFRLAMYETAIKNYKTNRSK